jgi:hypothetical protein
MHKLSTTLVVFSLLSPGTVLAQPDRTLPAALPSVALPPEFDRVLRDYEREWQARSAGGLAELFVEDGFVLQSGRPAVRGRAGITEAYRGSGGPLALRAVAFGAAGTVGYIIGAYSSKTGSPDVGKFILLLRREPGKPWRIVADMDNRNAR